jgi:hypothetical protein
MIGPRDLKWRTDEQIWQTTGRFFVHVINIRKIVLLSKRGWIQFLGAFAKLQKATISFVIYVRLSVRPSILLHGTTPLQLDGFSWNLIFEEFVSKICREESSLIKIGQEWRVLYTKTSVHFVSYLAHFFLEWEMFRTKLWRMTRGTNLMQQLWFIIISNSICFGHLYVHLQECSIT